MHERHEMNSEAIKIQQSRDVLLDKLNALFPAQPLAKQLFKMAQDVLLDYDVTRFNKDLHYLAAKGYVDFCDTLYTPFMDKHVSLTCSGKDIADGIFPCLGAFVRESIHHEGHEGHEDDIKTKYVTLTITACKLADEKKALQEQLKAERKSANDMAAKIAELMRKNKQMESAIRDVQKATMGL